jgi:hypothetical protein
MNVTYCIADVTNCRNFGVVSSCVETVSQVLLCVAKYHKLMEGLSQDIKDILNQKLAHALLLPNDGDSSFT